MGRAASVAHLDVGDVAALAENVRATTSERERERVARAGLLFTPDSLVVFL